MVWFTLIHVGGSGGPAIKQGIHIKKCGHETMYPLFLQKNFNYENYFVPMRAIDRQWFI